MSSKSLLLCGNEALVHGALLAGCDAYFGYPITPAGEIIECAAKKFPELGRVFIQAESEIGAICMVMGAAAAGQRAMTASSGLGISLMQEAVSYLAGMEIPCVIADVMRCGPGIGNISVEQSDYFQVVKGGGHGGYRCPVIAPASAQEMCAAAFMAFELAEKYRTPVYILTDGMIGQMMESVALPEPLENPRPRLTRSRPGTRARTISRRFTSIPRKWKRKTRRCSRNTAKSKRGNRTRNFGGRTTRTSCSSPTASCPASRKTRSRNCAARASKPGSCGRSGCSRSRKTR